MPRKRVKTRIENLADAHARLLQARAALKAIDLRTTAGTLRDEVREARDAVEDGLAACELAIRVDTPVPLQHHDPPLT